MGCGISVRVAGIRSKVLKVGRSLQVPAAVLSHDMGTTQMMQQSA